MTKIGILVIIVISMSQQPFVGQLISILVGQRILFPWYNEIEITGKYETGCEDYGVSNTKLPVAIASHGSCGTIDNNRSLYREFVSYGYVVLAGMLDQTKSEVEQEMNF